ncbi:MAG: hypothetical protein COA57_13765 [Flavobacteriales bacterium]|nr:MAG: hypothetical protein COA57_13765 [Flavobacteriales bacterium]
MTAKRITAKRITRAKQVFALLLLTVLVFSPLLQCGLTNWDDGVYISENQLIRSLTIPNLKLIFSEFYFGNYHPFTLLSYAVEYALFGENPSVFHLTNLLFHLLNVLLVFAFIKKISGNFLIGFFTATLFAIHPMHVESVVWISARKDVLYTFFMLLALLQYASYLQNFKYKNYSLALVFFLFSCLSKGMAVSLPLLLLVLDFLLKRKFSVKVITDKIPFFLLALFFGWLAFQAQHQQVDMQTTAYFTFFERVQWAGYAFSLYFMKLLLPINLSAFYPYPYLSGQLPFYFLLILPVLVLFIIWLFYRAKHHRKLFFGVIFFSCSIVFVLQILPIGDAIIADRYSYLSFIGLFYLCGNGIHWLHERFSKTAIIIAGSIVLLFSFFAFQRVSVWQNSVSLWSDVIEKQPAVKIAYLNRGIAYKENKNYRQALADFNQTIALDSSYAMAYNHRGLLKKEAKLFGEAMADYNRAIELAPTYYEAYSNRGILKRQIGDLREAMPDLNKALEINPKFAFGYSNRANLKNQLKEFEEAVIDCNRAIELNPYLPEAYNNMGNAYGYLKNYNKAISSYTKAIQLKPDYLDAYINRGKVKAFSGDKNGACNDWETARAYKLIAKYCQ